MILYAGRTVLMGETDDELRDAVGEFGRVCQSSDEKWKMRANKSKELVFERGSVDYEMWMV